MDKNFIYNPPNRNLKILFEDDDFVAVDKPSGLLTVPGRKLCHKDSLLNRLKEEFPNILLIHRLDMDTSGVVLFAKNKNSQVHLAKQFSERRVKKIYFARVLGQVKKLSGVITYPLRKDWTRRPLQKVCKKYGKVAETRWRLLEILKDSTGQVFSNLLVQPITGRTHQIRIHLREIGFPIIGDKFYGNDCCKVIEKKLNLHACSLKFYHAGRGCHLRLSSVCETPSSVFKPIFQPKNQES